MSTDKIHDETDVRIATESYQSEFPYDRDEEAQVTRREFCNFLGLTSAAFFVGSVGFAGKAVLDARETANLAAAKIDGAEGLAFNSALNFHYPTEKDSAILVRSETGEFHAFGQKCTHLACPVYYERRHKRLECPCHEGYFSVDNGRVLQGPPPRPLPQVTIEERNGAIVATGIRTGEDER